MANREYKNVKRFVDNLSQEIKTGMANEVVDIIKIKEVKGGELPPVPTTNVKVDGKNITADQEANASFVIQIETCLQNATIKAKIGSTTATADKDGIITIDFGGTDEFILTITSENTELKEKFAKKYDVKLNINGEIVPPANIM